ncbi:MAG: TRAP transporter small permease subunit [Gammaproteobacteria bacterium]|nr:TRAP transporter small permease subunit [Gammaproteobacteria bacterium]
MTIPESTSRLSIHDEGNEPRVPVADAIDSFIRKVSSVLCWLNALLIVTIVVQVVLRYGFGTGDPKLEELQWHLYAAAVMFGLAYAQVTDSHVRVDIVAMRLSPQALRFWEIFGILVFVFPFIFVIFYHSLDFVAESWRLNERSDAPTGLPWRWAIKAVIPLSFGLLALAVFARLLRDLAAFFGRG